MSDLPKVCPHQEKSGHYLHPRCDKCRVDAYDLDAWEMGLDAAALSLITEMYEGKP